MNEIINDVKDFKIGEIQFEDDTITVNKKNLDSLCAELEKVGLPWCTPNGTKVNYHLKNQSEMYKKMAAAFLCIFTAYRIASPAVVSPFEYSILLWASLNGWLFFDEIPNVRTIAGMILIVCGGIYIFVREKAQDQSIVTEKPLR
tara:strand:+ start:82 stop:516 length:435 start_codon:yes stop_codon:yes gene_type:complete